MSNTPNINIKCENSKFRKSNANGSLEGRILDSNSLRILRLPAVISRLGLSRSTIYDRVGKGLWPRPVPLGPRAVGWPSSEIDSMLTATVAGASDAEIRKLVAELQLSRMAHRTCT